MAEIDVDAMFARAAVQLAPTETPEERAARITRETKDAKLERVKAYVLFFVVMFGVISVGCLCAYEGIFNPNASADSKRWAQTALSALLAGFVSFVLGQATAKKQR
jgi:hypothetical protein